MEGQRIRISLEFSLPPAINVEKEVEEYRRMIPDLYVAGRMIDTLADMEIETEAVRIQRITKRSILSTR